MYNTYLTIIVPAFLGLLATLIGTRFLISYLYGAGIVAEDRNKEKVVRLAGSGGLAVSLGVVIGILSYTFGGSFGLFVPVLSIAQLLAVALSVILISLVGFLDDINVRERRVKSTDIMDIRQGLRQWQKPLLTLIGALPIIAVNAGVSTVMLPFLGSVSLGLLYPLIIIPLAIVFVSNAVNLLGGFDGLQPAMTLVASLGLLIYSIVYGTYGGALLSALLFVTVLAFLPFNLYKSKIIPGDSFTYAVGAALVAIMVIGNEEAFGFIVFMPWTIEFLLHLRRKFRVSDLGIRQRDGTFKAPYGKSIYSLTHLIMNLKKIKEYEMAIYLSIIEALFVILGLLLKFTGMM